MPAPPNNRNAHKRKAKLKGLHIRVTDAQRRMIKSVAHRDERTMTDWIVIAAEKRHDEQRRGMK